MAEEYEEVELEYSEEDILYYIEDEDGNQIGFAIEEDGQEVEYYYEGIDGSEFETVEMLEAAEGLEGETVEMEIDEDAILYYLVDEDDNEIGFVIEEDGQEVECYYEEEPEASAPVKAQAKETPSEQKDPGYLSKMASIAGYHGNKARKKAEVELNKVRGATEKHVDKATAAVEAGSEKVKAKSSSSKSGLTREDVSQATEDLNAIAKEGAATMKELKGTYDELMDSFGFLVPKKIKRRLP